MNGSQIPPACYDSILPSQKIENNRAPSDGPPSDHPETSSNNPTRQIWIHHTAVDSLLKHLRQRGIINDQWEIREPYASESIDNLKCDEVEETGFFEKFDRFIQCCYEVATMSNARVNSFTIIGSYVPRLIGWNNLLNILKLILKNDSNFFVDEDHSPYPYQDIDFRIEAFLSDFVPNFTEKFLPKFPISPDEHENPRYLIDQSTNLPCLDVERIRWDIAELTYCRIAVAEQARTEHQKFKCNLLPRIQSGKKIEILGSVQGLFDLWCKIGHWRKEVNNKWDWCAYVLMVTRGVRFPDKQAETLLTSIVIKTFVDEIEMLPNFLVEFKKAKILPEDTKCLYLLNASGILEVDAITFVHILEIAKPDNPLLANLINSLRASPLSVKTVQAVLQIIGLRALLNPDKSRSLPYGVELISHNGEPYFRFLIAGNYLLVPLNLSEALKQISKSAEYSQRMIDLIKLFGGLRDISYSEKSPLFINRQELSSYLEISLTETISNIALNNPLLQRVSYILFTAKMFLNPTAESLLHALEQTFNGRLQEFLTVEQLRELLENHLQVLPKIERGYLKKGIGVYFDQKDKRGFALALLPMSNESIFLIAFDILKGNHNIPFDLVDLFLSHHKIGRVIAILEHFYHTQEGTNENWQRWLNQCIQKLASKGITSANFMLFQVRTIALTQLWIQVIDRLQPPPLFIEDIETLRRLLQEFNLHELDEKVTTLYERLKENERKKQFEKSLEVVTNDPSLENFNHLLSFLNHFEDKILNFIPTFLEKLYSENKNLFRDILGLEFIISLYMNGGLEIVISHCIQIHFKIYPKDTAFLINFLNDHPLANPYHLLQLLTVAKSLENKEKVIQIHNFIRTKLSLFENNDYYFQEVVMTLLIFDIKTGCDLNLETCTNIRNMTLTLLEKDLYGSENFLYPLYEHLIGRLCIEEQNTLLCETIFWLKGLLEKHPNLSNSKSELEKANLSLHLYILKHFRAEFENELLNFNETIEQGKWPKKEYKTFNEILINSVRNYGMNTPQWLLNIIQQLINYSPVNKRYMATVNSLAEKCPTPFIEKLLVDSLKKWRTLFLASKSEIPLSMIKAIINNFPKICSCKEIENLGSILTDPDFIALLPPSQAKKLLSDYFSKFFILLFNPDSLALPTFEYIWNQLKIKYKSHIRNDQSNHGKLNLPLFELMQKNYFAQTYSLCNSSGTITTEILIKLIPSLLSPILNINYCKMTTDIHQTLLNEVEECLVDTNCPEFKSHVIVGKTNPKTHEFIFVTFAQTLLSILLNESAYIIARNALIAYCLWNLLRSPFGEKITLSPAIIELIDHFLFSERRFLEVDYDQIIQNNLLSFEKDRFKELYTHESLLRELGNRKKFYLILFGQEYNGVPRIICRFDQNTLSEFGNYIISQANDYHCGFNELIIARTFHVLFDILPDECAELCINYAIKFHENLQKRYSELYFWPYLEQIQQLILNKQQQNLPKNKHNETANYFIKTVSPYILENTVIEQEIRPELRGFAPYGIYINHLKIINNFYERYRAEQKNPAAKHQNSISRSLNDIEIKVQNRLIDLLRLDAIFIQKYVRDPMHSPSEKLDCLLSFFEIFTQKIPAYPFLQNKKFGSLMADISHMYFKAFLYMITKLKDDPPTPDFVPDNVNRAFNALLIWSNSYNEKCDSIIFFSGLASFITYIDDYFKFASKPTTLLNIDIFVQSLLTLFLRNSIPWVNKDSSKIALITIDCFLVFLENNYPTLFKQSTNLIDTIPEDFRMKLLVLK